MRFLKKYLLPIALVLVVVCSGFFVWISGKYVVPIMMYHNVDYTDVLKPNTVSPQNFERQMAYLKEHGFNVLSFENLVRLISENRKIPRKSVVITFDDGYADNYTHAFKILKKYGFPAIVFMPSDLVGRDGHLTWPQLREMTEHGIAIGSHTRLHAYLPDLSLEQQREEIFGSKRVLEAQLGVPVKYFAYPIGGFSNAIKEIIRQAGYQGAAATNRGYDRFNKDVFELNRVRFSDKDNRDDYLWMKLSGAYNIFRKAKHPY